MCGSAENSTLKKKWSIDDCNTNTPKMDYCLDARKLDKVTQYELTSTHTHTHTEGTTCTGFHTHAHTHELHTCTQEKIVIYSFYPFGRYIPSHFILLLFANSTLAKYLNIFVFPLPLGRQVDIAAQVTGAAA